MVGASLVLRLGSCARAGPLFLVLCKCVTFDAFPPPMNARASASVAISALRPMTCTGSESLRVQAAIPADHLTVVSIKNPENCPGLSLR